MKKTVNLLVIAVVFITSCLSLIGCKDNTEMNKPTEEEIKFSTFEYTYDTLIDDIVSYGHESVNGKYRLTDTQASFFSNNKSVENLIDKTLVEKMRTKNIDEEMVYYIAKQFPDSWYSHCKLVIWNDIYKCYYPILALQLDTDGDKTLENKVTTAIKKKLRDPESFYMTEGTGYIKFIWDLYVKCNCGDTLYYVDDNGEYTQDLYFFVEFYAKNGFGGYNKSGVWLSYSYYPLDGGYVYCCENKTGNDEYNSGFNLYGEKQNLKLCGSVAVWK